MAIGRRLILVDAIGRELSRHDFIVSAAVCRYDRLEPAAHVCTQFLSGPYIGDGALPCLLKAQ